MVFASDFLDPLSEGFVLGRNFLNLSLNKVLVERAGFGASEIGLTGQRVRGFDGGCSIGLTLFGRLDLQTVESCATLPLEQAQISELFENVLGKTKHRLNSVLFYAGQGD